MFGIEIREEAKHMITGLKDQKTIINITTIKNKGLKLEGQSANQDFSWNDRKMLANSGPGGEPIATPSTCL
jgi:DNA-binding winged helix-turn-helix (wHTH) protein